MRCHFLIDLVTKESESQSDRSFKTKCCKNATLQPVVDEFTMEIQKNTDPEEDKSSLLSPSCFNNLFSSSKVVITLLLIYSGSIRDHSVHSLWSRCNCDSDMIQPWLRVNFLFMTHKENCYCRPRPLTKTSSESSRRVTYFSFYFVSIAAAAAKLCQVFTTAMEAPHCIISPKKQ